MSFQTLPVSNVVNVSLTGTPSGLTLKNVNTVAIFTQDAPLNGEQFGKYISPSQLEANYGTNSKTSLMGNALFAQLPNVLSGEGYLTVVHMIGAVSAVAGNFTTTDISANIANFIAVTNGDLGVTVNGTLYNLGNLNFSSCATLADIAAIIQAAITNCQVTAVGNTLKFISKKVGSTSTVALSVYGGGGTDLTVNNLLHTSAGAATGGTNSAGETILACLARTQNIVAYAQIMSTLDLEDAAILTAANGIQAQDYVFYQHCASTQDFAGIGTTITNAGDNKTRILCLTNSMADANLMKAAYVGRGCSVDFTGSNTSQTMNLKQLATINTDTGIDETAYLAAQAAGVDLYVSYDGVPSVVSNGANNYFDQVYSRLAYKFALQTEGFNFLRQTNTKIPQTETGMNGLKDAYNRINRQFVRCGYLAPGQWNSGETFGDPEIFNNNILNNGYYTYSLPIAQQSSVQRDARVAPLVQIAAKEAGAIHSSNVLVIVSA